MPDYKTYESCSDPCPHVAPTKLPQEQIMHAYKASVLGLELNPNDLNQAARTAQEALQAGAYLQPYIWHSCKTGIWGSFTLLRTNAHPFKECVTYEEVLQLPVKMWMSQGLACRDSSGFWRLVTQSAPREIYKK